MMWIYSSICRFMCCWFQSSSMLLWSNAFWSVTVCCSLSNFCSFIKKQTLKNLQYDKELKEVFSVEAAFISIQKRARQACSSVKFTLIFFSNMHRIINHNFFSHRNSLWTNISAKIFYKVYKKNVQQEWPRNGTLQIGFPATAMPLTTMCANFHPTKTSAWFKDNHRLPLQSSKKRMLVNASNNSNISGPTASSLGGPLCRGQHGISSKFSYE